MKKLILALLLTGCTIDSYEKGEGKYSLMQADLVEAHADNDRRIDYVLTDDGQRLVLGEPLAAKWIATSDTLYRCILYYNKVNPQSDDALIEAVSMSQVPCPEVKWHADSTVNEKTDPVKWESGWVSRKGTYLNLSLYLMTGVTDDEDAIHRLGVTGDTIVDNGDGTRTCLLTLRHDQGGVPEYYSSHVYLSIPIKEIDADSVGISINTYAGRARKIYLK